MYVVNVSICSLFCGCVVNECVCTVCWMFVVCGGVCVCVHVYVCTCRVWHVCIRVVCSSVLCVINVGVFSVCTYSVCCVYTCSTT